MAELEGPPSPSAGENPIARFLGGVGDVASGLLIGPQDPATPLTTSQKVLRSILTIAAASQNPAGLFTAHDYYRKGDAAQAALLASPDFQALSPEEQRARLGFGYELPSLPTLTGLPTPTQADTLEFKKSQGGNQLADEAKTRGSAPDYQRALGLPILPSQQGAEAATVIEGARKAGVSPESWTSSPGGAAMGGETPGERRYVPPEEVENLEKMVKDAGGLAPGFTMGVDERGVFVQAEGPMDARRRRAADLELRAEVDKKVKLAALDAESTGDELTSYMEGWKELATPQAFALQKPGSTAEGVSGAFYNWIWKNGPETTLSQPRKLFIATIESSLAEIQRKYGGEKGVISDKDIERARAGLTDDGISRETFFKRVDGIMDTIARKVERANARASGSPVARPMASHAETKGEEPAPSKEAASTGDPDMDAILRARSQKGSK